MKKTNHEATCATLGERVRAAAEAMSLRCSASLAAQAHMRRRRAGDDSAMLYEYLTPLRAFLRDDAVSEICVNRPGEVWTESHRGWERHGTPEVTFDFCHS